MVDNSPTPSTLGVYNVITENYKERCFSVCHTVPYSKVTKEPVASIFHPEEGSGVFLRNATRLYGFTSKNTGGLFFTTAAVTTLI
jgi:hypothetical protein